MTSSATHTGSSTELDPRRPRPRGRTQAVALALVVLVSAGFLVRNLTGSFAGGGVGAHRMPQSAAMEDQLGIRFSRVAVVGDGGLVTVTYVVLDSEKASRFQADVAHPPLLKSDRRKGTASRVSLMKQGHSLRAGQQYYLVYQNPADLVRHNESVEIDYGRLALKHVPVW